MVFATRHVHGDSRLHILSESVRGKYASLITEAVARLRDDVDQELEHVSFTLDTIKLAAWSREACYWT